MRPSAATYTRSQSAGSRRTREITWVSRSPAWLHVLPPSELRYSPSPCITLPRSCASPMPAYTTSGLASHTASAPTELLVKCRSDTGRQVTPPSPVFQTPPPVAPK
ncbi:MAG TPA: hypothetical protein VGV85_04830 [Longimicrobiaceae bacterium]|nr:hypothetical protein [Longimicrobiaceae bacterium]